jgi:glycosyltransferase involved in cell wall biosynthesis
VKLLILGDSAGTGFGTVTADLGSALLRHGQDVRFISLNEQPNGELEEPFVNRTAIIGQRDGWLGMADPKLAQERLARLMTGGLFEDGWTPEAAVVIGDAGSLKISPLIEYIPQGFPAFHYIPIEGVGLPPSWAALWANLRPVAISEFGADEIAKLGVPRPPVIYHGVNTEAFYPVSEKRPIVLRGTTNLTVLRSKHDCSSWLSAYLASEAPTQRPPDRVTIFRSDRHMPRKNYASLFRAVAPVLDKYPDADLIYHCATIDHGGDLDDERSKYGPLIGRYRCRHPERCRLRGIHPLFGGLAGRMIPSGFHDHYGGAERKLLNVLYNAASIYASVSAEGFGLTIAEALAAGTPAVAMAYSAVPEVMGQAGILVPSAELTDNTYSHFWARVDEPKFSEALDSLVRSRKARRDLGALGPIHVGALFSWDRAAEQFGDLVAEREAVTA